MDLSVKKDRKEKKPYLQNVRVEDTQAVTEEGEIYTAKKTIYILQPGDKSFKMMFNELVVFLNSTDSLVDVKVLNWITDNLPYNSEEIILNKHNKNKIVQYTGFSYSAVEKAIGSLTSKKILVRDTSCVRCAVYMVNPSYVWYGDTPARENRMEYVLRVSKYQDMDPSDKKVVDDIKRYENEYLKERKENKKEYHKSVRKTKEEKNKEELEEYNRDNMKVKIAI